MSAVASPTKKSFSRDVFEAFRASRSEPHWMSTLRTDAFDRFEALQRSPLDPEEWKRVDLRAFRVDQFAIPAQTSTAAFGTLFADRSQFAGTVSHVDGTCTRSVLLPEWQEKGVVFGDLNTLLKTHPQLLEKHLFTRGIDPQADRFTAWHTAFCTGGTILYVPRNLEVTAPLYSLIGLASAGAADFSHTLVILEEGSSATLLEETSSSDAKTPGLHCGGVELLLAPGSRLRYVQLQNWNESTWHFARQVGRVERNGYLQWTVGGLGSKLAHTHQDVHLDDRGANAQVNGVTFATNRQVISYYTQQWHNAPDTQSDLLYKDVLRDRSRVIWRGMIKVAPGAVRTDGYQRNDGLLMSDDARADAIPGLEIETDDVRCTHGATVGRVDDEQLMYCMSRGISRNEAMHMIVEGFFQRVFDRIPVESVRETLNLAVQRKLGIGEAL